MRYPLFPPIINPRTATITARQCKTLFMILQRHSGPLKIFPLNLKNDAVSRPTKLMLCYLVMRIGTYPRPRDNSDIIGTIVDLFRIYSPTPMDISDLEQRNIVNLDTPSTPHRHGKVTFSTQHHKLKSFPNILVPGKNSVHSTRRSIFWGMDRCGLFRLMDICLGISFVVVVFNPVNGLFSGVIVLIVGTISGRCFGG